MATTTTIHLLLSFHSWAGVTQPVKWIGIPGLYSFHMPEFFCPSTCPHWIWNPTSLPFYMLQGYNFYVFHCDCWSVDSFLLVSMPFCGCVFSVSVVCTAFIFRIDWILFRWMLKWLGKWNVCIFPYNPHIPFFPTTSAYTWTRFSHPEHGGSTFFWNDQYTSMALYLNPKVNHQVSEGLLPCVKLILPCLVVVCPLFL